MRILLTFHFLLVKITRVANGDVRVGQVFRRHPFDSVADGSVVEKLDILDTEHCRQSDDNNNAQAKNNGPRNIVLGFCIP